MEKIFERKGMHNGVEKFGVKINIVHCYQSLSSTSLGIDSSQIFLDYFNSARGRLMIKSVYRNICVFE